MCFDCPKMGGTAPRSVCCLDCEPPRYRTVEFKPQPKLPDLVGLPPRVNRKQRRAAKTGR